MRSQLPLSERRACAVVVQARATQRRTQKVCDDEAALKDAIVRLAKQYGRYGYRRVRLLVSRSPVGTDRLKVGTSRQRGKHDNSLSQSK